MAREATPPVVKATQPKRRRAAPLRTSFRAQITSKKGLGPSQVDLSKQTRRISSSAAGTAKDKSKQVLAARNRADDAENNANPCTIGSEAQPTSDFADPFDQAFPDQAANSSMLSNTNMSDGTVIRYENDPCLTPPYKALSAENRALARRVDSLENKNAHLQQTRYAEGEAHRAANANLASQSHAYMTESTYWQEQAALWMGDAETWQARANMWEAQAVDRDGEVQRLQAKLQELVSQDGRFENGDLDLSG